MMEENMRYPHPNRGEISYRQMATAKLIGVTETCPRIRFSMSSLHLLLDPIMIG